MLLHGTEAHKCCARIEVFSFRNLSRCTGVGYRCTALRFAVCFDTSDLIALDT